jgi:putative Ca2+/H+ antiporter (TMEM165/GDT1 family)
MDWTALLSTFGLLFLAELGDKTQLAVIAQTCRYRRPWAVFLGASLALAVITGLGVVAGQLTGRLIPGQWVRWVAAAGFVVMGVWLGWETWRAGRERAGAVCDPEDPPAPAGSDWRVLGTTFGLLALAELGDKTQLAVFARASAGNSPWAVFAGGTLALILVTAIGVVGGEGLVRLVPERTLRWIAAAAFVVMGILIGVGVL